MTNNGGTKRKKVSNTATNINPNAVLHINRDP